jgi:hypothetical protein
MTEQSSLVLMKALHKNEVELEVTLTVTCKWSLSNK